MWLVFFCSTSKQCGDVRSVTLHLRLIRGTFSWKTKGMNSNKCWTTHDNENLLPDTRTFTDIKCSHNMNGNYVTVLVAAYGMHSSFTAARFHTGKFATSWARARDCGEVRRSFTVGEMAGRSSVPGGSNAACRAAKLSAGAECDGKKGQWK